MKVKLNKKEVASIAKLSERILKLRNYYETNDVELVISSNGSVYSNLDAALACLDTILQEY